jgi:hypothetical protein
MRKSKPGNEPQINADERGLRRAIVALLTFWGNGCCAEENRFAQKDGTPVGCDDVKGLRLF